VSSSPEIRVESLDEAQVHIALLMARTGDLERRIRELERQTDTWLLTPAWKRWLFIADGWSGHRIVAAPAWRPWRRWWTS
jgi:hypothetical protein